MDSSSAIALRKLIEDVVNGEASAERCAELERALLADPAARSAYIDYVNLHSALSRRFLASSAAQVDLAEFRRAAAAESYASRRRAWKVPRLIALACLIAALITAAVFYPTWRDLSRTVAEIRQATGEVAIVEGGRAATAGVGSGLGKGRELRTIGKESSALLKFPDGTTVLLHGDSAVAAPDAGDVRLRLIAGSMEVHAAKQAPGKSLIFSTAHSRVVVVGTRFRLYHEQAATRLELDEGKVELQRAVGGKRVDMDAGNVATIAEDQRAIDIQPLALGRAQLEQTWKRAGDAVAFSRDGERVAVSDWGRGFALRETSSDRVLKTRGPEVGRAAGLAFSADESHVLQLNRDGALHAWRLRDDRTRTFRLGGTHPRSHALSVNGHFAVESADRSIAVFELDVGSRRLSRKTEIAGEGKAWCLAITPDGRRLAAGYWDGTVRIYDTASHEIVFDHRLAHTPTVVALADDAQQLAVFSQKDGLLLLPTAAGEPRQLWPPGHDQVRCVRFTADGTRLLAGMKDRTARMWSVADGRPMLVIDTNQGVQSIAWCEERQLLATADGTVKLWKCDLSPAPATGAEHEVTVIPESTALP